jgi:anti-sigma regulatory factor (Ser/Thr protein kinase)
MQIDISVEEIFVNISQYAYPGGVGYADIQISGSSADGRFIIVFRDRGIPYDPLRKSDPDITLGAEDRPIGGLGIFMVKKNMDKLEYSRSGGENILTMTKNA